MATTGLHYASNDYDRDRFERTARIAEGLAGLASDRTFTPERPYLADVGIVTPKVGCNVAAFTGDGRLVLIKRSDNGRWALPSGWAEVGTTPVENALRELREETGLEAEVSRLVGVWDSRWPGSAGAYHFFTICFLARVTGGTLTPSHETPEVILADPAALPSPMTDRQRAMIARALRPDGQAFFE